MELFAPWFNIELPLDDLCKQCPFVKRLCKEYVQCFHCVYNVNEFDWVRYISEHNMTSKKEVSAYDEWMKSGRSNGYIIGCNELYTGFPWEQYQCNNPELSKHNITSELQLYEHWVNYGRKEKRTVVKPTKRILKNKLIRNAFIEKILRGCITSEEVHKVKEFDWNRYLRMYTDLSKNGITTEAQAYYHWVVHGRKESRNAFVLNTSEKYTGFPWETYKKHNPDLKHLRNEIDAYKHWITDGRSKRCVYNSVNTCAKTIDVFNDAHYNHKLELIAKDIIDRNIDVSVYLNAELKKENELEEQLSRLTPTKVLDFSNASNFCSGSLNQINKNIDVFSSIISEYKNILFICSDYPGYGGAATNCDDLSRYYSKTHNVHSVYWTHDKESAVKYGTCGSVSITHASELKNILNALALKPDLVILKNAVCVNIKEIWNIPVFFLIPGIYCNNLDKNYRELNTITQQHKYINENTLRQIRESDFSFCNSIHTQQILRQYYKMDTYIFCSSFVKYYGQSILPDPEFENRKYDYGLIISNFERTIKNAKQSISFLKDKKNVLLIGEGSSKYKSYGFDTIEHVKPEDMGNYYKQIKHIVQDGFYESCSNVMVEGLFNGCKTQTSKLYILTTTQTFGYGGGATNTYYLYQFMKKQKYNVVCIFVSNNIVDDKDEVGDDNCFCITSIRDPIFLKFKTRVISHYGESNIICLCKNYATPIMFRQAFAQSKIVYLVAGSMKYTHLFNQTGKTFTELVNGRNILMQCKTKSVAMGEETTVVKICDYILCNSNLTRFILETEYNNVKPKLYLTDINTSLIDKKIVQTGGVLYKDRHYDIIFCVTSHNRKYKGSEIMNTLFSNTKLDQYSKLVIGDDYENVFNPKIKNITFKGKLGHSSLIENIKNSRIVIVPSFFDSSPNILYEAIECGCNVLLTRNIGNYHIFKKETVVDDFSDVQIIENKINLLLKSQLDYNLPLSNDKFIQFLSYIENPVTVYLHKDTYMGMPSYYRFKHLLETVYNKYIREIISVDVINDKDILTKIKQSYQPGDIFIGRFGHTKHDYNITHKLYPDLHALFGLNIYPTFNDYQYFENKQKQMMLYQRNGYNIPISGWVETQEEAEHLIGRIKFPCVAKTPDGAGNSGVRMVSSISEITYPCILQEFIDNNYTLRLVVIGEKIFGYKRINKEDDFTVSPSENAEFPETFEMDALDTVYQIYKDNHFCSMSFDLMFNTNQKKYVILEMSYTFATKHARKIKWYYDMSLKIKRNRPFIEDTTSTDFHTEYGSHIEDMQMAQFFRQENASKIQHFDY